MNDINWPQNYLPGITDFYVANETIMAGVNAVQTWPFLAKTSCWPAVYAQVGQINSMTVMTSICAWARASSSSSAAHWCRLR